MNRRVGQLGLGWVESSGGDAGESLKLSLVAHSRHQRQELVGLLQNTGLELSEVGGEEGHVRGSRRPPPVWAN